MQNTLRASASSWPRRLASTPYRNFFAETHHADTNVDADIPDGLKSHLQKDVSLWVNGGVLCHILGQISSTFMGILEFESGLCELIVTVNLRPVWSLPNVPRLANGGRTGLQVTKCGRVKLSKTKDGNKGHS